MRTLPPSSVGRARRNTHGRTEEVPLERGLPYGLV